MSTRKIVPTIGRVVLVWPREVLRGALPWCGLIADVMPGPSKADPYHITVGGFSNSGHPVVYQDIPLLELAEGEPVPAHAYACWMPFQLGQASKTDNIAGQLAAKVDKLSKLLVSVLAGHPFFLEDLKELDTGVPVPEFCAPSRPKPTTFQELVAPIVNEVNPPYDSAPSDPETVTHLVVGDSVGVASEQDGGGTDGTAVAELPADADSTAAVADVDSDLPSEGKEGSVRSATAAD